ncbi:MAG TPA: MATE family efflux transporter [Anaerohalosphaeraceae bacterium]|nr:MATE family efflux transporter [Anaerohalosphaeraceae bacterium]
MDTLLKRQLDGPGGIREMLAIAMPMVVSNACDTVMIFTDRLFLAQLGSEQMAAAMGGGLTSFMLTTFFLGLTGYCTALAAQYFGAGRKENCARVITQGLLVCLLAYPAILCCRPLGLWLFELVRVSPEQLAPQKVYFNILIYGTLIGLVRNCLSCFFSGVGKTSVVMFSTFAAMITNVGLDYVFIFGKLGFPAMGIAGAAYATLTGGIVGLSILAISYFIGTNRTEFAVSQSFHFDWTIMKKLLRYGYPTGVEFFLNMLAFTVLVLKFHGISPTSAAAVTVVFNWDMVSFIPLIGIHIGVISLVGRYMGARQPDTAHRATLSGLKLAWAYSFCTLMIFALLPHYLVGVFRPAETDPVFEQAFPMAVTMVRMAALYVMADAMMLVFGGALRGAGDTFWVMCISVTMHWSLVGVLDAALRYFHFTPQSAWSILCITMMLFSGVLYLRYRSGKWRSIQLVGEPQEPLVSEFASLNETREV